MENTGLRAGDEVVQLYVTAVDAPANTPIASLQGFQRISLDAGMNTSVRIEITPEMLAQVNDAGRRVLEPGRYRITLGGCSPGERGVTLGAALSRTAVLRVE